MQKPTIVIFDFGSQYTQLLARRIRDLSVYCEIHPVDMTREDFLATCPIGVILSGGPASVTHKDALALPTWLFELNLPVLGVCYGMQAMAMTLGGQVAQAKVREYGYAKVSVSQHLLFSEMQDGQDDTGCPYLDVWMSHGDHVAELPPGFEVIGETFDAPIAAMAHQEKPWFGLQFHPEVTHTKQGEKLLSRFVFDICQAQKNWTMPEILSHLIETVKANVGEDRVLLGLSGGVDSSVVAALLHEAIGSQLECMFVDTGLLRLGEKEEVEKAFTEQKHIQVTFIDAKDLFLKALQGVTCPEEKRKIIGHLFIEVFEKEAKKLTNIKWLAQGTIYPDVIESAAASVSQASTVIKSHHNVGGLPEHLPFLLLEPIRTLFKDEVRKLGLNLGLPSHLIDRHPFPGPGLAVRVLGEVKPEYVACLRQADNIFIQALREYDFYQQVSQAFVVFLPVKSVGVMGDGRVYEHVVCLRAVTTQDFMTAESARLPWDFLDEVARRIMNQVKGISRVIYDISGKPPATIEWE